MYRFLFLHYSIKYYVFNLICSVSTIRFAKSRFTYSAIGSAASNTNLTSTILPIYLYTRSNLAFSFLLPDPQLNSCQSGNVCILAISFTDKRRLFSSPSLLPIFTIGSPSGWIGVCLLNAWIVKMEDQSYDKAVFILSHLGCDHFFLRFLDMKITE